MENEAWIRMGVFLGVFLALACLESLQPRRRASLSRLQRWPGAGVLFIAGAAISRLIAPAGLAGLAIWADGQGIGVFNLFEGPVWVVGVLSFLIMDLSVWAQHVAMHRVPLLWRMHRVHHADPHLDVVTALRFHPAEILVSMVWKAAIVVLLGPPVVAVLVFEIVLNATAMFTYVPPTSGCSGPSALSEMARALR